MARSWMVGIGAAYTALGSGNTHYQPWCNGGNCATSSEDRVQAEPPEAGTLSHLGVNVTANTVDAACTVRSRINGANGDLSISITASTTGTFEDTTNSDSVAANDLLAIQYSRPTSTGSITIWTQWVQFDSASYTSASMLTYDWRFTADSTTYYSPFGVNQTGGSGTTTRASVEHRVGVAGTLGAFWVKCNSNARTSASTVEVLVNGSSGNISVSIPATTAGTFEDVDTVSVSASDTVCAATTLGTGSGESLQLRTTVLNFRTTTNAWWTASGQNTSYNWSGTYSTVKYAPFCGISGSTSGYTTRTDSEAIWPDGGTIKGCSFYVSGLSAANVRLSVMVDGVATVLATATATGRATSATEVTVPAGSKVCWRLDSTAGSGDWTVSDISGILENPPLKQTLKGGWDSATSYGTGSWASGSFTPSANALLIAIVSRLGNSTSGDLGDLSSISGGSLSWTKLTSVYLGTSWSSRYDVYYAQTGSSPSAMTVTVDDGNDVYCWHMVVVEYTGHDTTTPITGLVTSGNDVDIADGAHSLTLTAAPTIDDYSVIALMGDVQDQELNPTWASGWTELANIGVYEAQTLAVGTRIGSTSTTAEVTDVYTSANTFYKAAMVAFNVKAAAESGGTPPTLVFVRRIR